MAPPLLPPVPAQKGALMKKQAHFPYFPLLNSRPLRDAALPAAGPEHPGRHTPSGGSARRNRTAEAVGLPKGPLIQSAAQEAGQSSAGFPGLPGRLRRIPSGPEDLRRRTGVPYGDEARFPSCRAARKGAPASDAPLESACGFPQASGTERPNRHAFRKPGRPAVPLPER